MIGNTNSQPEITTLYRYIYLYWILDHILLWEWKLYFITNHIITVHNTPQVLYYLKGGGEEGAEDPLLPLREGEGVGVHPHFQLKGFQGKRILLKVLNETQYNNYYLKFNSSLNLFYEIIVYFIILPHFIVNFIINVL